MAKTAVKIFTEECSVPRNVERLERKVNQWLESGDYEEILSISYQVFPLHYGTHHNECAVQLHVHSVLIHYRPKA